MKKHVIQLWHAVICLALLLLGTSTMNAAEPEATGISLNKTQLTLTAGEQPFQLIASITPTNADQRVRWTSNDTTIVRVDETGKVTPLKAGTATIIATAVSGGRTALCQVTVQPIPKKVSGISLDKSELNLPLGTGSVTLAARIQPSDATNKQVNWVSSNPGVAKVDSNGKVTAVGLGSTTIIATTQDGGYTAICRVNVTNVPVSSISLDKAKLTLDTDDQPVTLHATIVPSGASNKKIKWSSSDTSVATVNEDGTVTPRRSGIAIITAVTEDGSKKAICTITVRSNVSDVFIDWESDSRVAVTWEGTTGSVRVELKRGSAVADAETTSSRKAIFTGLDNNRDYHLYMDGQYVQTFRVYQLVNRNIRNFTVKKNSSSSVTIEWNGTSGTVRVDLVEDSEKIDYVTTSRKTATFDRLDDDSRYKVYISGKYAGAFKIEDLNQNVRNLEIKKYANRSVDITWDGTQGTVEVSLYYDGSRTGRKTTSSRKVTFTGLDPTETYDIYLDDKYYKSFKLLDRTFKDIQGHWAQESIERLAYTQLINGFPDGSFRPDETVTKEQFVTMLVKARGYTIQKGSTGFRDVSAKEWSSPYIYTAMRRGIIEPGTSFYPNRTATREEMAVMVARSLQFKASSTSLNFKDNSQIVNKGLVGAAVKEGIILGYPDRTFKPKGSLTRAEAVIVIDQIIEQ